MMIIIKVMSFHKQVACSPSKECLTLKLIYLRVLPEIREHIQ